MTKLEKYKVGDVVFDGPSQMETTIAVVKTDPDHRASDDVGGYFYELADNVPLNPTGDGAFPDRWRNTYEICKPEDKQHLKDFIY